MFTVSIFSFIFALALTGCAFQDEGVEDPEGQCPSSLGTIVVIPLEKEGKFRQDLFCEEARILAGICGQKWEPLASGQVMNSVCFEDDGISLLSLVLPKGGIIEADRDVSFELYPFNLSAELGFEKSPSIVIGKSLKKTEPIIIRIRTLPRSEE